MKNLEFYEQAYRDPAFVRVYQHTRDVLYQRIAAIIHGLGVSWVLDIGCSLGRLVDHLHREGLASYGADFDLPELRAAHQTLACRDNFLYGDVSGMHLPIPPEGSAITLLDTIRYISAPEKLAALNAQFLIIKEVSPNLLIRFARRKENDGTLYTPARLAQLFPTYRVHRLYASRFLFSIPQPGPLTLALCSLLPTYTAVLARR